MNLLRAASVVSLLTLASRITGLVREQLIAASFGATAMSDAYQVAFRIPNLLRRLFAEGAFSQAFVPILAATRAKEGDEATHALIDRPGTEGFTVNGAPVTGPLVRVLDADAAEPQVITNGSGRAATLTLTTFGVPTEPEPAGGKGYAIVRSYYTLEGEPADIATVRQGTRLVAVVEVTPTAKGEARLIVNDPLPAGFEIDNPSLLHSGDIAALGWLETAETRTAEFRQDRFIAAVDWTSPDPFRLAYILRAISPGTFRQPAASVEDMYRPDYRARTATGTVTVTE